MSSPVKRVLVTGATGYIGRRLADRLSREEGISVRLLARNVDKVGPALKNKTEVIEGDVLDPASLEPALSGVETAYYLVHSMGAGASFPELDRRGALHFREACIAAGARRIVYLGGLGDKCAASRHLLSRIETGEILSARPDRIQTVWFRAGIVIGSGSASFEIVRHLVQKLPVMITPRFVRTRTQPIGVGDVVEYLAAALSLGEKGDLIVDVGSEVMTFRQMLLETAEAMGLKRLLIPVPFLTPRLASYWLVLVTPVPYRIAGALVNGLRSETVARNDLARTLFPGIRPRDFRESVRWALKEAEEDQVLSAWCDSSAQAACDVKGRERIPGGVYRETRVFPISGTTKRRVFDAAQSVGGRKGWPAFDRLWRVRGFVDKILGGPGSSRGRRDAKTLRVGDSLDFWKVVDYREGHRILLADQMKLPGQAWLEFLVEEAALIQTAYFLPRGLGGILYWFLMKPFHTLIFGRLGKGIVRMAREGPPRDP